MLNALIRFSLQQRVFTIAVAILLCVLGTVHTLRMPIDVFPDLNRPRVVIMTEAHGMAPEEVETLISFPLETAMNGISGVEAVRSSSAPGLSVIYVEFDWGTEIYRNRQLVAERLQTVTDRLPPETSPQLAPVSSIMGQIVMLAVWNDREDVSAMQLRTAADWVLRPRLLGVRGIAQVFTMGGERRQFQVLADADLMRKFDVGLNEIEIALTQGNENVAGGFLTRQGGNELLVRSLGRVQGLDDLRSLVVTTRGERSVLLGDVAKVSEAGQVKRGDSAAFLRDASDDHWQGGPAVVLTVTRQPGADTRLVSDEVMRAVDELRDALPQGTQVRAVYSQKSFIDRAIANVLEALRDGVVLVVIVLFLFLMNFRTTLITLTAIPLSLVMTSLVFAALGMSINTMTLGGLAVAIGELVDDAIVDVENIFRRLRLNRLAGHPLHPLLVIYRASVEVRSCIVYSTMIVVLVFVPLFALDGIEGRLFVPLGLAYIVSILASLLVSLTVTPALSWWLLGQPREGSHDDDGWLLRRLKQVTGPVIRFSLRFPWLNLAAVAAMVVLAAGALLQLDRDFLPSFNEGTVQLNVVLPPGTSLQTSQQINRQVEQALGEVPDVVQLVRRTGRAELDEHAEGVNTSEYLLELNPQSKRTREEQLESIREVLAEVPGIVTSVEQPISHLISHMLSGIRAQVGIRIFGDDLEQLRREGERMEAAISQVDGVRDLMLEPQVLIPQLQIQLNHQQLARYGVSVNTVNRLLETALQGHVVGEVLDNQRPVDLLVRLDGDQREDLDLLARLPVKLPQGGLVPLGDLAQIKKAGGPNTINRDDIRRRIVLQCNVSGRGVVDVVQEIQQVVQPLVAEFPSGYFVEYSGQFQSQQTATRALLLLFGLSLLGVFLLLYSMFRSVNLALQVMAALPMAFIGSVVALVITGQSVTIAAMVGFISLGGIASRNGILLLNHYLHLVREEGEQLDQNMIVRAGLERLAPVLMTALTAAIGLLPLTMSAGQPGREILYPVATVIVGGVISSTLLDFLVHPALFWLFGLQSAAAVTADSAAGVQLTDES